MSGVTANLNNTPIQVDTGNDSIVIVHNLETIPGGKTLDVTGFTPDVIKAGHLVIKDASGNHKPMPVNSGGTNYDALPANHTYVGIVISSVLKTKPFVGIMVRGTMNDDAFKNGGGFPTPSGAKTALNLIRFTKD